MKIKMNMNISKENCHKYTLWVLVGLLSILLTYVFYKIDSIIPPFLIGFLGAYALHVPMEKMQKLGIPRSLGAVILITLIFSFLAVFFSWCIPFVRQELTSLIKIYPDLQVKIMNWSLPYFHTITKLIDGINLQDIKSQFSDSFGQILKWGINFIISLFTSGFALANILSVIILTPLVMFYFLKDWNRILCKVDGLLPSLYAENIRSLIFKINDMLGAYVRGQLLVCLSLICLYMICLNLAGLPQASYIGFLTGFLAFIPYLGITIGFLLSLTVALTHSNDPNIVFNIVCIYLILGGVEGYLLTPRLIGERIGLHPILIIFALLSLGSWFGIMGIIFALPLSAIMTALTRAFLAWYRKKFA